MSRKSVINPYQLFTSADISTDYTSPEINMKNIDSLGFSISWSGTAPVGVLYVDARISETDWHELDFGTTIDITGATGLHNIQILAGSFEAVRLRFVSTSGTGTMGCYVTGKVIGA